MKTRLSSSWNARFLTAASVSLLLALVSCAGAGCRGNASGASGSTTGTPAQSETPVLRLHGEIPPEMGLRFELTFKATADERDCKKRSLVDGELYPLEERRTISYDSAGSTYQTNVPLRREEPSQCDYRISTTQISFANARYVETGGRIRIVTDLQGSTLDEKDHVPLPSKITVLCQENVENLVWASSPLECDNMEALSDSRQKQTRLLTHHIGKMPIDTLDLELNVTLAEDTQG